MTSFCYTGFPLIQSIDRNFGQPSCTFPKKRHVRTPPAHVPKTSEIFQAHLLARFRWASRCFQKKNQNPEPEQRSVLRRVEPTVPHSWPALQHYCNLMTLWLVCIFDDKEAQEMQQAPKLKPKLQSSGLYSGFLDFSALTFSASRSRMGSYSPHNGLNLEVASPEKGPSPDIHKQTRLETGGFGDVRYECF